MKTIATKVCKSKLMKRAWSIYNGSSAYSGDFSIALSRAWFIEKDAIRSLKEDQEAKEWKSFYNENKNFIGEMIHITMYGEPSENYNKLINTVI